MSAVTADGELGEGTLFMDASFGGPPSVLLATGSAGGTIAGVRCLSNHGVDVGVVSSRPLCAASWSRHAKRTYRAPAESDDGFLEQILAIGAAVPGQVLLATSDETAWLYSLNADLLRRHFRIYQPPAETMRRLLDKELLAEAATKAGLAVLPSRAPRSLRHLSELAQTLTYPILIKPRTHVQRLRNDKGCVVRSAGELIAKYRETLQREGACLEHSAADASRLPILQQFVDVGPEGVHSITGFIDRTGDLFVTRRSTKIFLRSWPVGVGVCYESLPPLPTLSQAVHRFCRDVGYFGVFEIEFLWREGTWAAIDFNPRFFNQMGLDLRRGMPLPWLAWLDACNDRKTLSIAVKQAQGVDESAKTVFYDRFTLRAMLLAQRLTARMAKAERAYWKDWTRENAGNAVDVAADPDDRLPGFVHALSEMYLGAKAAPRFLKAARPVAPAIGSILKRAPR